MPDDEEAEPRPRAPIVNKFGRRCVVACSAREQHRDPKSFNVGRMPDHMPAKRSPPANCGAAAWSDVSCWPLQRGAGSRPNNRLPRSGERFPGRGREIRGGLTHPPETPGKHPNRSIFKAYRSIDQVDWSNRGCLVPKAQVCIRPRRPEAEASSSSFGGSAYERA